MHLEFGDGSDLILKAYEKREEDKAWQLYLARYQHMDEKSFMPFEEFYNPQPMQQIENKTEAEILESVKQILDSHKAQASS